MNGGEVDDSNGVDGDGEDDNGGTPDAIADQPPEPETKGDADEATPCDSKVDACNAAASCFS